MTNKKLTFAQVIEKFDDFEEKFANNPGDKSLPEFFEIYGAYAFQNDFVEYKSDRKPIFQRRPDV